MPNKPDLAFEALGTHWQLTFLGDAVSETVAEHIIATVSAFERAYSRFLPDSLLGQLNHHKVLRKPPHKLIRMLSFANEMYEASGGIFDISVGGTLNRLGYGKADPVVDRQSELWHKIIITNDTIRIPENCQLDFGGFGKGWLIDELAELLEDAGCSHYVINGGGDIRINANNPVEVALEHPLDPTRMIGTTRITHGALGVSSSVKRVWRQNGKAYHHIIDPRTTTSSASEVISTFVRANTARIADAAATILLVEPGLEEQLAARFNLKTILIKRDQLRRAARIS